MESFWEKVKVKKYRGDGVNWDCHEFAATFPERMSQNPEALKNVGDETIELMPKRTVSPNTYKIIKRDKFTLKWRCYVFSQMNQDNQQMELLIGLKLLDKTGQAPDKFMITASIASENEFILYETESSTQTCENIGGVLHVNMGSLAAIWDEEKKYFPEGTIRFRIDMILVEEKTNLENSGLGISLADFVFERSESSEAKVMQARVQVRATGTQAEIQLRCGSSVTLVHRAIISAQSQKMARLCESLLGEDEAATITIRIQGIKQSSLKVLIDFVYFGNIFPLLKLRNSELLRVGRAGRRFEIEDLHKICFHILVWNIRRADCIHLVALAAFDNFGLDRVSRDLILYYCYVNKLVYTAEFQALTDECPAILDKIMAFGEQHRRI